MKEIKLRNVHLSDAKRLAEINRLCWQKNYRGIVADQFLDNLSLTEKRIERFQAQIKESDIYLCALQNNQIVGYLSAYKEKNENRPAPYEIRYLYIHPDFQHQGIGQKLFHAFMEKINHQPFYLYMLKGNTQAQKFYQNMGGILQSKNMDIEQTVYNFIIHEVCWLFNPKE